MNTAQPAINLEKLEIFQANEEQLELIHRWTLAIHKHEDDKQLKAHPRFNNNLKKWLHQEINNANSLFLVALLNRQPAGFIAASVIINDNGFLAEPMKGMIHLLWVEQAYRRFGIAKNLLTETEACLSSIGVNYVECNYTPTNSHAQSFWKRCGYQSSSINARKILTDNS